MANSAIAELRRRGNRFNLLVIGRGEEQERVRAAVREHALNDCVHLIDHVPHDQISRYYSVVDVMVFLVSVFASLSWLRH